MDYLCIIVMFLSAVWTLILTAPIHCRASIAETVIQCYISPNIQTHLHCLPIVWKRPRKMGFGQYWHESFLICDNFAVIRNNTNYENIFYYINSLYIEKTSILDSSKYPPLAAITALHNLGIRAVIDLIYYSKPPEGLPKDDSHGWTLLTDITVQFLVAQLG